MKLEFSRQIFRKYSNIEYNGKLLSGLELFHADGQTDITKLTVVFRNLANGPKNFKLNVNWE